MNKKIGMRFGVVLASIALVASGTVAAHGAAVPKERQPQDCNVLLLV